VPDADCSLPRCAVQMPNAACLTPNAFHADPTVLT
jgi:hypothetical protein